MQKQQTLSLGKYIGQQINLQTGEEEETHRKRSTPEHITKEANKQRATIQSMMYTQNKTIIDSTLHRKNEHTNTASTEHASNMEASM
jgi:hypothetical protein